MTDIEEKLNLPVPLKVKPSIAIYLDKMEDEGNIIWAFEGFTIIENIFYLYLMNKYKSKCIPKGTIKPIGLDILLKDYYYTKEEEQEFYQQFNEIGKIIADCVKRGEKTILIPISYRIEDITDSVNDINNTTGHFNLLVYKVENNEIEHFEPHGSEVLGDLYLQDAAKAVILYFVDILNEYLKNDGLQEVKYIEASQVCPYIRGLQNIEENSKLPKGKIEPQGYCTAWGLFFSELNLKNPTLTSSEILDNIYSYLTTKESGPNYLRKVIRGYAGYIYQTVDRYLEIFFKPKVRLCDIIGDYNYFKDEFMIIKIEQIIDILIDLEMKIVSDPLFDYQKELKIVMNEYNKHTQGKNKDKQRVMRENNKELRDLYYKKRILQNYEEYKRDGYISEPVFDSPEDIRNEDIKNLTIIEKGHLHELLTKQWQEEKQRQKEELERGQKEELERGQKEELEKQSRYIKQQKKKKKLKKIKKSKTICEKSSPQNKTKKHPTSGNLEQRVF
jgi:hypothetical protein